MLKHAGKDVSLIRNCPLSILLVSVVVSAIAFDPVR